LNGIDRFLPAIVLDARVMSPAAKGGNAAGVQADTDAAAAFGGHLEDLSRQEGKASDSAALAGHPNRTIPAFVQQSFLLATKTVEAAGQGPSGLGTIMPDRRATIASQRASGKTPEATNAAARSAADSDRTPATATGSMIAGPSQSARKDTLARGMLAPVGDVSIADDKSPPPGQRPASNIIRDAHNRAVAGNVEVVMPSPLAPGYPLLSAFPATGQAKGDASNGPAASQDSSLAGAASVLGALGEKGSLEAPPAIPHDSHAAWTPPLAPISTSQDKPVTPYIAEPYASLTADPLGGQSPDFAAASPARISIVDQQTHFAPVKGLSPAQQLANPSAGFVPVWGARDTRGLASSGIVVSVTGESTIASAVKQASAEPRASHTADPNGGSGPEAAASAPVKIARAGQQSSSAPAKGISPAQQLANLRAGFVPVRGARDTRGLASPRLATLVTGESTLDSAATQEIAEPQTSPTADPNGGHGLKAAASAPVKIARAVQQSFLAPPNGLLPAEQIGEWVTAGISSNMLAAGAATVQAVPAAGASGAAGSLHSISRVQTMQVQLDPESLGKVTVSMRIAGSRLDLRVETERPETMQLIGDEKDLLAGKLQAAGYSLETLIIQPVAPPSPHQQMGVNTPSNGPDQSAGQSTGQANGGPSTHDHSSTHDDRQRSRPVLADETQDGAGVRLAGGDLYL